MNSVKDGKDRPFNSRYLSHAPRTKMINWKTSKADAALLAKVYERSIWILGRLGVDVPDGLYMDLTACHNNECPLDLGAMLDAGESDFMHDVLGIHRYIDRTTGKLGECFLPRFSARSAPTTP